MSFLLFLSILGVRVFYCSTQYLEHTSWCIQVGGRCFYLKNSAWLQNIVLVVWHHLFIQLFTFSFLVSPSQLQKRKSVSRKEGRLDKRLGKTWGYKNKINEKRLLSDPFSGPQKLFPLSLLCGLPVTKSPF